MAASAVKGSPYLQVGPRQGVYCRPAVVLTAWPNGGYQQKLVSQQGNTGRLRWRLSQFRSPEHDYRLRARTDSEEFPPDNIPEIPGQIIERPSSAVISRETANKRVPPPKMQTSHSSCSLNTLARQQHSQQQLRKLTRTHSATHTRDHHKKTSTAPVFSIQACAVTIQSRPLVRSVSSSPKKIAPPDEPFPYPDPVLVGGDHAFSVRLAELTRLQRETIKSEELRQRIARRNATITTSSSATSLQNNARQLPRPSSSVIRPHVACKNSLDRKTSLPAPTLQDKPVPEHQHPVLSRKLPVPPKTNNSSTTKLESDTSVKQNAPEGPANNKGCRNEHNSTDDSVTKTVEHSLTVNVERNEGEEGNNKPVIVQSEVSPKTHHRELVKAIFSGEKMTLGKAGEAGHGSSRESPPTKEAKPTSFKTKPTSLHEAESPASAVSSRSNSSTSSSSISSEHSPSRAKSQAKPSKTRKHPKKTVRHKHTML